MLGNKGTKKFYRTGGTRGGQDQFQWSDVKGDKYRENYLGHSVNAPVGRWLKNTELNWYTKDKDGRNAELEEERIRMRQMDEDLMNETLGLKRKRSRVNDSQLDSVELKQLLERGTMERSTTDAERIQGLGAAPAKSHDHIERVSLTSIEKEIIKIKESSADKKSTSKNYIDIEKSTESLTKAASGSRNDDSDSSSDQSEHRHKKKSSKKHKDKDNKKNKKSKKGKREKISSSSRH